MNKNLSQEHAYYISSIKDLEEMPNYFTRVYFGSEFCEKLIPSKKEIEKIYATCESKNLNLTLTTPYCTDKGITKLKQIIPTLKENTEIVFNEWGVFNLLSKQNKFELIQGRLLSKQKKDPRTSCGSPKANNKDYLKTLNLSEPSYLQFLEKNKVSRAELDNTNHGFSLPKGSKIKFSLHYPFVPTTTGMKCFFQKGLRENFCNFECKENKIILVQKNKTLSKETRKKQATYLKGNTHFYFNGKLKEDLVKYNIDRLIFSKNIPC